MTIVSAEPGNQMGTPPDLPGVAVNSPATTENQPPKRSPNSPAASNSEDSVRRSMCTTG